MLGFETVAPPEPPRSRRRLVAGLVLGGVLLGLVVAGGVSVLGRYLEATAAAGPSAPPLPRATPALATLACGDRAPAGDGDPERTLVVEPEVVDATRTGARFAPGATVPVRVALVNVGADVTVRAASDVVVVAVRDGAVVGAPAAVELRDPDEGRADPYRLRVRSGIGHSVELAYPLVGCTGGPLLAGEYGLMAAVVVTAPDGTAARELVGGPVPFAVE